MDKIKEGFDSLPIAACFFDINGMIRLVNHRMLAVMNYLRPNGIQTLTEFEDALITPPETVCILNTGLNIYHFPDDRVLAFSEELIFTRDKIQYTQITATDVTELIKRQEMLKAENEKLSHANERLKKLIEQMPELIREEETLQMKLRVHDDIGHSILASRRMLLKDAGLEEIKASAMQWEQSIAVLYRYNEILKQPDSLAEVLDKSHEMGVAVVTEGEIPSNIDLRKLLSLAIGECATNCVRHADGTRLFASFKSTSEYETLTITNNGEKPHEEISEGGGLSILRHRVEESGGSMKIESFPCFKLIISLPKELSL